MGPVLVKSFGGATANGPSTIHLLPVAAELTLRCGVEGTMSLLLLGSGTASVMLGLALSFSCLGATPAWTSLFLL